MTRRDVGGMGRGVLELPEEAHVTGHEHAQVGQVVAECRHALHADAEGKARVPLGIDTHVAQDVGVDHAATQDLEPAGVLAEATALALCRRLLRPTLKSLKTINSKTVNEQQCWSVP